MTVQDPSVSSPEDLSKMGLPVEEEEGGAMVYIAGFSDSLLEVFQPAPMCARVCGGGGGGRGNGIYSQILG